MRLLNTQYRFGSLFVPRQTIYFSHDFVNLIVGPSRSSSVFSALLCPAFLALHFTFAHLSWHFFLMVLSQPRNPPCSEIYCSRSIIRTEVVLDAKHTPEPCPIMGKLIFHVDGNLGHYSQRWFSKIM